MKYLLSSIILTLIAIMQNAYAKCEIVSGDAGQNEYYFRWEQNAPSTTEVLIFTVKCTGTTGTLITLRSSLDPFLVSDIKKLSNEIKASEKNLQVSLQITQIEGNTYPGGKYTWDFVNDRFIADGSTATSTFVREKGTYRIIIENNNAVLTGSGKTSNRWNFSSQSLISFTDNGVVLPFRFRLQFSEDINPCKIDAFQIKTLPSNTISFGSLDLARLNSGQKFPQPFSIEVSRRPESECKDLIQPKITFYSDHPRKNPEELMIDNSGLLLMIRDHSNQPIPYDNKQLLGSLNIGEKKFSANYKAEIRKDPDNPIKIGEFSAIVRYIVEMK